MMYTPIKKLSRVNANLQQAMAASERIFEMLDTHSEVQERPGAQPLAAAARRRSSSGTSASAYDERPSKTDPEGRLVQRPGGPGRWRSSG